MLDERGCFPIERARELIAQDRFRVLRRQGAGDGCVDAERPRQRWLRDHPAFLDAEGRKLKRMVLGSVGAAAVKLDSDQNVIQGLHNGEGVETCIPAMVAGYRPVWAVGSAGARINQM